MVGRAGLAACAALVVSSSVHGQCADWRVRGSGLFYQGAIRATTTWDPDGSGPQPPLLVAAGYFDRVESLDGTVQQVAAWNGTTWTPLGGGIVPTTPNGYAEVWALAVYNGELIAAGDFGKAGDATVNNIARWNGTSWQPLGSGITGSFPEARALTVIDGQLIVGGTFTAAGGVTAGNVAAWNGSTWSALGFGVGIPGVDLVQTLINYNGQLVAGGKFVGGHVAAWDGFEWRPFGDGVDGNFGQLGAEVKTLLVDGNDLLVGGRFKTAGGAPAKCLARWTGTQWFPIGNVDGAPNEFGPVVNSLARFNGKVFAGGWFNSVDGASRKNITFLNGTSWQPVSSGVEGNVDTLAVYNGELVLGGWFLEAGPERVKSLARWNGNNWVDMPGVLVSSAPGVYTVNALTPWRGSMVIGGMFPTAETSLAGLSYNLIAFTGAQQAYMGDPDGHVEVLTTVPGPLGSTDLIAAGTFTTMSGVPARSIARLNDTEFTGWHPMGAGFNNYPTAVVFHNGSVYAAGYFTMSGTTTVNHIARWNGTAWESVGPGLDNAAFALASYNGSLYVGGAFEFAGDVHAGGLARWDGQSWNAVEGRFIGSVDALKVHEGKLVIGGLFPPIDGSANLVSYDAASHQFARMGDSGPDNAVRAITVSNGTLVVGGYFASVGGVPAKRLARWNGEVWSEIGGGVDGPVYALSTFHDELHVGGTFGRVRNGVLNSPLWARFSEAGAPWIAAQPLDQNRACGSNFAPGLTPAAGYGGLVYQWRKNGVPLVDGPTGTGSTIVGSGGNFGVLNVSQADAGVYDCVLSNACGSSTSSPATLTVTGTCPGLCYANCDGSTVAPVLNVADFICFQNKFAASDPYANCDNSTVAPVLNVADFICYLNRFSAGCP